jgi:hypothetical protein
MTSTNTVPTRWTASLIDTGDGSGDMMIELPDDLLAQLDFILVIRFRLRSLKTN